MEEKKKTTDGQVENPNLSIYNKVRKVPPTALKAIGAGRLKGMSDVNPMFRIKILTEVFGICGFGWKYEITKQWNESYGNEVKTFCNINLYVKMGGEWSEPIPGTGGSSFVTMERNGTYVSDENNKMALTDALSVAMKSLGVAADVYFAKDADLGTKYAINEQAVNGQLPVQQVDANLEMVIANIKVASSITDLTKIWNECYAYQTNKAFVSALTNRKKELKAKIA